ncbi:MAG: hypothetical protein CTY18_07735 [Methylomonas sp.]|nr:MAG: hypothetical protein CTY24_07415 [Methylobacter sp.]PPD34845.1 MAG: hypothetical protein CTY18_07735 [Methylomonas sp.]
MIISTDQIENLSVQIRELDDRINNLSNKQALATTVAAKLSSEINQLIAKQITANQQVRDYMLYTSDRYHL